MPFLFTYVSLQFLFFTSVSFFLRNMRLSILIIDFRLEGRESLKSKLRDPRFLNI